MSQRPNVLLILSDQHNAKVMGHMGHPDVRTPNLDRLASEGVRFDNAITQNPVCTPSRVSWLSGQYCHNHGYYGLSGPQPRGLPTMLGHFRGHGYRTAAIGKIHCPENWVEKDSDCFHEVANCSIGGTSPDYVKYLAERGVREDHTSLYELGNRGRQVADGRASFMKYEDSMEAWSARTALDFMRQSRADGQPFVCHVSLPKPHQCYTPSEPFWSWYDESKIRLPPNADYPMEGKAPHMRAMVERFKRGWGLALEPRTYEAGRLRKMHGYLGNVSHVDHTVGELLEGLRAAGLENETIVVYSTDHGDYACEHGILEKAPGICSDAITRIPMIWRWPGQFSAGHVVRAIAETVDFVPTVCSLAGLDSLETADGRDICALLRGGGEEVHRVGVTEFAWSKSVRRGPYRLVVYPREMFPIEYPDGFGELYNLEQDPWERTNLYFRADHAGVVKEMERELLDWLLTTTRPATIIPNCRELNAQRTMHYDHAVNADGKIHPDRIREAAQQLKNYL